MRRSRRLAVVVAGLAVAVAAAVAVPLLAGGSGSQRATSIYNDSRALELHPAAGSFKPDATKLASCAEAPRCLEQAFGNLAYYSGPKSTLHLFQQRMQTDSTVESDCHRIAHTIGSASLARFHGDVAQAFARGDSTCWSGYYHGILERSFAGAGTPARFLAIARNVCSGTALRQNMWLTYQCVHGLGHGLMIQSGYNLPFSLKICDRLRGSWDQTSCTGGVFMENVAAGQTSAYGVKSPWLKDDDLVYPCNVVAQRHKLYCYWMLTSRVLQANGYDWRATAKVCAGVERDWVDECFQSYGRDADGSTRQDAAQVLELCALAGKYERECVYGAARDMTANYSSGAQAAGLCNAAASRYRRYCFYGIGTIVGTIEQTNDRRLAACAAITRAFRPECVRGATGLPL
jgi:hypothetical protein